MTPMQIQMQTIPLAVSHAGSSRDAEGAALVRGWPQGLGPMSMGFHGSGLACRPTRQRLIVWDREFCGPPPAEKTN